MNKLYDEEAIKDIADAIRLQNGTQNTYRVSQMADAVLSIKDYVTPEMYGAVGDGVTDDTDAVAQAINSGMAVNLVEKSYKITQSISVSNNTVYNGTLVCSGNARINGESLRFENVEFEFTGMTAETQMGVYVTSGINEFVNCQFGKMVADLFAYQINASNCTLHVHMCRFDTVRVLTVNGTQGDNTGVGRHVVANTCDAFISDNVFLGFYGENTNYLEDSDCVHTVNCEHAVILNNKFSGYWKSAIKNQTGNVEIIGNTFVPTASYYVVRSHTEAKSANIVGNIIGGKADVCFYIGAGIATICSNIIDMYVNILTYLVNPVVVFNDNNANVKVHSGVVSVATQDAQALYYVASTATATKIESNSIISSDSHVPYNFNSIPVTAKFTGRITGGYTNAWTIKNLTGEIVVASPTVFENCNNICVHAFDTYAVFRTCSNVKYRSSNQESASQIQNSSNVDAKINFNGSTYCADITASTNVVIQIFGTLINSNIVKVNDGTSTGIALNYINNRQGIYNPNSATLSYIAKSMHV